MRYKDRLEITNQIRSAFGLDQLNNYAEAIELLEEYEYPLNTKTKQTIARMERYGLCGSELGLDESAEELGIYYESNIELEETFVNLYNIEKENKKKIKELKNIINNKLFKAVSLMSRLALEVLDRLSVVFLWVSRGFNLPCVDYARKKIKNLLKCVLLCMVVTAMKDYFLRKN